MNLRRGGAARPAILFFYVSIREFDLTPQLSIFVRPIRRGRRGAAGLAPHTVPFIYFSFFLFFPSGWGRPRA